MENEQHNETSQVTDMKVLSGRAHEYVVNFRNKFLTYFALPLFLLFIALALVISWMVLVPARSEYTVILDHEGIQLLPETANYLRANSGKIESLHILYTPASGTPIRMDCEVKSSGQVKLRGLTNELKMVDEAEATLVLFTKEERFLFKLLDELAKNLKVKKPPTAETE